MNDQAKKWVWNYADTVRNICKKYFPQYPQAVEDMTHEVLLRISQSDGLDQVGDRSKWMREVAFHECMDYFRGLKRNQVWKADAFEDPGAGADEDLSDEKLDKEARGSAEDIEKETDEPEKIDPVKCWLSFKRHDPDRAGALIRSSAFVRQTFPEIKWNRNSLKGIDQDAKLLATLQDAKRQMEKIHGTCTDQDIRKYADSIKSKREMWLNFEVELQYHIRELIGMLSPDDFLADMGITNIASKRAKKPDYNYNRGSISLDLFDSSESKDGAMRVYMYHYHMRIRDFIHTDPDPLYVLYRVWNRILRKGRNGKYGNRKLLEVLFFAFKKISESLRDDDTIERVYDDTFDSLTEETNFETLRTMSYRLNKGYSKLADFIFRKSIRPPKRKITPTDKKKPAPPSSISLRH